MNYNRRFLMIGAIFTFGCMGFVFAQENGSQSLNVKSMRYDEYDYLKCSLQTKSGTVKDGLTVPCDSRTHKILKGFAVDCLTGRHMMYDVSLGGESKEHIFIIRHYVDLSLRKISEGKSMRSIARGYVTNARDSNGKSIGWEKMENTIETLLDGDGDWASLRCVEGRSE